MFNSSTVQRLAFSPCRLRWSYLEPSHRFEICSGGIPSAKHVVQVADSGIDTDLTQRGIAVDNVTMLTGCSNAGGFKPKHVVSRLGMNALGCHGIYHEISGYRKILSGKLT